MANKKINELSSRTPALSDLMIVGDPSSGYSYKCTVTALATIIETDIADGYVTIGTTQTISGAKTFSNNLTLTSVVNTPTDPDKFLTLNASNVVTYRTGAEVLSDIGGQAALSGTGIVKSTGGTISYLTDNSSNWNTAYDNMIVSAAVTGTTTKTLTLTQQDAGTITASWTDINTDAVTSVFGRTGAVVATEGDYTLTQLGDVTITTPSTGQVLKYNGTIWVNDTDANTGTVTSVALSTGTTGTDISVSGSPITSSGTITLNIPTASATNRGALSSTDWTTFNNKQNALTLTTTGTSGAATLVGSTLNIPQYQGVLTNPVTGTGTTNYIPKFTGSSAIGNSIIQEVSGQIGIGAAPSAYSIGQALDINGGAGILGFNNQTYLTNNANYDGAWKYKATSAASMYFQENTGNHIWYSVASGTAGSSFTWSERMRLDASGNLGLGTSSPSYKFQAYSSGDVVIAATDASNAGISALNLGNTTNLADGGIRYDNATDALIFRANNSERARIDASGNLGLGVVPSAFSSSYKAIQFGTTGSIFGESGDAANYYTTNTFIDAGGFKYITTDFALGYFQENGVHSWRTAPSGTAGNAISFTQAMTLDASGRLGIGQTSPQYRLDVYGGARIENAGEASIIFRNNTWGNFTIGQSAYSLGGGFLSIGAASAIMTFDGTNQRVGIGTTSPTQLLTLEGADGYLFTVQENGANKSRFQIYQDDGGSSLVAGYNSTATNMYFYTGSSERMRITSGGDILVAGTYNPYTAANRGNITLNGTSGNVIGFTNGTATRGFIYHDGSSLEISNITTNPIIFSTINAERMRITSGGNVGVGTTSPESITTYRTLQVTGGGVSTGGIFTTTTSDGSLKGRFLTSGGEISIGAVTNNPLVMFTNDTERMRLTSSGELLINTTSDAGDYKLQVNGNGYFSNSIAGLVVKATNTGASSYLRLESATIADLWFGRENSSGTSFGLPANSSTIFSEGAYPFSLYVNGSTRLTITSSGNTELTGSIKTAAPSGGTAKPWKLGEAGVTLGGSNTSGVRVEIDGVVYYLVTGYLP